MGSISEQQFAAMVTRLEKNNRREAPITESKPKDTPLESVLHERIQEYCDSQWPKWKFIHARMDQRSTIQVGAPDFTIFLPGGKVLCVECKRKGGKPTVEQSGWRMQMNQLGHDIKLITSMNEFMDAVKGVLA